MPRDYGAESLAHDPVHGYIPFISKSGLPSGETSEQEVIDHPWVQRLRHIHQLQTAWWVFPSAEHMRFQHSLGVMHLASRVIDAWYDSLCDACPNVPSRAYVESLVRMAGLLHDVGHGPFGHFFDDQYLDQFGVTHEDIGAKIIREELGDLLRGIRRNPNGHLQPLEELDPEQVAWLIRRPARSDEEGHPEWLRKLRALFSGIYTVDNMDFVLRDAYMTGYNTRAFDLERLLHYSFFTSSGLTIHVRGLPTLINFIETRANLFRTVYFHRTVRALDLALEEVFGETMPHLFSGNPIENLSAYRHLTESSLLVDIDRWADATEPELAELGGRWRAILCREVAWKMAVEKTMNFHNTTAERMTIFSEPDLVLRRVRERLPASLRDVPLKIDVARHYHRPSGRLPAGGQNYLYDPGTGVSQELSDDELFRALPVSFIIFRIYCQSHRYDTELNAALNAVIGDAVDAKTNM
ncbi:HD domain-containing protein [Maioricimonas sp. JC845]|uniref:HD domain-containing protein n=1 Tax=Maioricimonas sp. JC845 TaxID=3232138 RepID=UPI00345B189B